MVVRRGHRRPSKGEAWLVFLLGLSGVTLLAMGLYLVVTHFHFPWGRLDGLISAHSLDTWARFWIEQAIEAVWRAVTSPFGAIPLR